MSDIHANREALEACLLDARAQGAGRFVFLGDFVGYGADPKWVIQTCGDLMAAGAVGLLGNHDSAISDPQQSLSPAARAAIDWTRAELNVAERAFLQALPLKIEEADRLYVHADATAPADWIYVRGLDEAYRSLRASPARLTFHGHVHRPALYTITLTMKLNGFLPITAAAVPLLPQRRWLAVLGAVGQPRDGNPAAAYALLDDRSNALTFMRVPYLIEAAARKIRAAGLPATLAERLFAGG